MKHESTSQPRQLSLHPGDVAAGIELALHPGLQYADLAEALGISLGESHNAVRRLTAARLVARANREAVRQSLLDFLVSGVPYAFPAELGPVTRGVPTAYGAPPLASGADDTTPVWPSAHGTVRGPAVTPLYPAAPELATRNPALYQALTLVDALRIGRARDRQRAASLLRQRLLGSAAI